MRGFLSWLFVAVAAISFLWLAAYVLDRSMVWVASADEGDVLPPAKTIVVPPPQQPQIRPYSDKGDVVHYRCHQVGGFTVMEPVDCLDCKPQAFSCVNCECTGEK